MHIWPNKKQMGSNVLVTVEGTTLTIEIDLRRELIESIPGKQKLIATTKGNETIAPGMFLQLRVFKYI